MFVVGDAVRRNLFYFFGALVQKSSAPPVGAFLFVDFCIFGSISFRSRLARATDLSISLVVFLSDGPNESSWRTRMIASGSVHNVLIELLATEPESESRLLDFGMLSVLGPALLAAFVVGVSVYGHIEFPLIKLTS